MKRRRRKRSSRNQKKWQLVLLITAVPAVFIGLAMILHPQLRNLKGLPLIGTLYFLSGCAVITAFLLRKGCHDLHERALDKRDIRRGAALITVLVLTATLAAITLHTQALTTARLRLAGSRSAHALLNDNATELAFHSLQKLSRMSPDSQLAIDTETPFLTFEDPHSEVSGEVFVSTETPEKDDEDAPTLTRGATEPPASGRIYTLRITTRSAHRTRTILCLADRENSGALSIHRWVEPR